MKTNSLHPYFRVGIFLTCILSIALAKGEGLLLLYMALLFIITMTGLIKGHLQLLLIGILPVFLSYAFIYVFVGNNSYQWSNIGYKIARITCMSTALQILLLIKTNELVYTLHKYNIKGNLLITVLSSYSLIEDIKKRAEKIIDARLSRGYIKKRTRLNMAKQMPHILTPLFIQVFRSSLERAESWQQKDIIQLIENYKHPVKYNLIINYLSLFTILSSCLWIAYRS